MEDISQEIMLLACMVSFAPSYSNSTQPFAHAHQKAVELLLTRDVRVSRVEMLDYLRAGDEVRSRSSP